MATLALMVIVLFTMSDQGWVRIANIAVWTVFVVDYAARLAYSGDRRRFVRTRLADLVAILPADVFRMARLARLARLLRAWALLGRSTRHLRGVLKTNGLGSVLMMSAGLLIAGGMAAWAVEPAIDTAADGLWWALVTATTVGYGDISPQSGLGRLVAAVLMLVGIGAIGLLTATFATYFIGERRIEQHPHVEFVRRELGRWQALTPRERRGLVEVLRGLSYEDPPESVPQR